ncbi:MAG: hypothetical protein ACOX7P_04785 [Oscillospiraceae bacterium]|jgi:hypothetical protein
MSAGKYSKSVRIAVSIAALLCLAVVLGAIIYNSYESDRPRVKNGILDLTDRDIDSPVSLDGEWEFYWQEFFGARDFARPETAAEKLLVKVPGTWDKYKNGSEGFPWFGYATYRAQIIPGKNRLDGIKLKTILTAARLFVNGKEYRFTTGVSANMRKPGGQL